MSDVIEIAVREKGGNTPQFETSPNVSQNDPGELIRIKNFNLSFANSDGCSDIDDCGGKAYDASAVANFRLMSPKNRFFHKLFWF